MDVRGSPWITSLILDRPLFPFFGNKSRDRVEPGEAVDSSVVSHGIQRRGSGLNPGDMRRPQGGVQ